MKFEQGFKRPSIKVEETPAKQAQIVAQSMEAPLRGVDKEGVESPSVYDFERLSPVLQQAVTERTEKILEATPLDKRYMSGIFNLDQSSISPEELAYFEAYGRIAARQLVLGDFFGDEEPIKEEVEVVRELTERPLGKGTEPLRTHEDRHLAKSFGFGNDLMHDMTHTWVDLAENDSDKSPSAMVPKFLRYKRSIHTNEKISEASAHDEDIVSLYNIDGGYRTKGGILKSIRKAKSREEFLNHDYLIKEPLTKTEPPPFKKYVRGRVYDEYKTNPHLLFDIFVESTLPLMKKYAPDEVTALEKSAEVR